ncbi:MAG TPA: pyridoxamine 5'-phosphate oxidase family protein [Cellulomonadaceae bacterium]|jgi:PPOX class probable F420-dependent enzyme|nr:pyridoxamine 5'-phosphate oxidase family protein [Cellulomonadaceae bacterium]
MAEERQSPMGHGVKQRDVIKMTPAEIDDFLQGRRTMNCATINHDGTIHLVAMWYGFLDGCPALETKAKSQKVQNLRRSDQISALVEDGQAYDELRGVELVGRGEVIDDPDRMFELGISVFERYQGLKYNEEMRPVVEQMLSKRVVVKIHIDRYVSWDHGKLGLPSTQAAG